MPELPEVETIASFLNKEIAGEEISSITIYREKNIETEIEHFKAVLQGNRILKVHRKGKFILFELSSNHTLLSHLRMEGKFFVYPYFKAENKHDILFFAFSSGKSLVYNDVRKFGRLGLYTQEELYAISPLSKIAKDVFEISPIEAYSKIRQSKLPIKSLLMDQSIVSGIGNIYADEALFKARINPRVPGKEIEFIEMEEILRQCKMTMEEAILLGGSTIRSYHPSLGMDGKMQNKLEAYGNDSSCPNCSLPMRRIFINSRSAHFCPYCQKRKNAPIVIAITGPIHSGKTSVCNHLKERGFDVFDCDNVAKSLYFDSNIARRIEDIAGIKILTRGKVDFEKLRKKMKDAKIKKTITDILYPELRKKAKEFIERRKEKGALIFEIPLLKDSCLEDLVDYVVYIDASLSSRKERLEKENRDADSLLQINSSYPASYIKKEASYILPNEGRLEELYSKIDDLPIFKLSI